MPGKGPQNYMKDSTGHLYSAMIGQGYFNDDIVVSPVEANPVVAKYGDNAADDSISYEYGVIDPATDIYWMGDTPDPVTVSPGTSPQGAANRKRTVKRYHSASSMATWVSRRSV